MIQFVIADTLPAPKQLSLITDKVLEQYQKFPFIVLLSSKHQLAYYHKAFDSAWPQRAILTSKSPEIGTICIMDQLPTTSPSQQTCVINTHPNLMIDQKNCKVLIEIVIENRQASRDKYKHYMQLGIKPHVEHIN